MEINNIFCVGRNYRKHAEELGNTIPKEPIIFSKPTHSIVYAQGQQISYPLEDGEIHYEIEVVLRIKDQPKGNNFTVNDSISHLGLGIDLTKRDLQTKLKERGYPWLLAKGFKNAAILTDFWDFPGEEICKGVDFSLTKNGHIVQKGNISQLIFPFEKLLRYIHQHFGLKKGDIVFTGTPEGVGPISHGDFFEMWWGEERKGEFKVKTYE